MNFHSIYIYTIYTIYIFYLSLLLFPTTFTRTMIDEIEMIIAFIYIHELASNGNFRPPNKFPLSSLKKLKSLNEITI